MKLRFWSVAACCASALVLTAGMGAQTLEKDSQDAPPVSGGAAMRFTLQRSAPEPKSYAVFITDAGEGRYFEGPQNADPETQQRLAVPIHAGAAALKTIFAARRTVLTGHCETRHKGIAQSGVKTLEYLGPEKTGTCSFNYSDDDHVNEAATEFEAIVETLHLGEQLARLQKYDRLGLDAAIQTLAHEAEQGRAAELGNIHALLASLAADPQVLERVRRQAASLLEQSHSAAGAAASRAR